MANIAEILGKNIEILRCRKGLTQAELAKALDLTRQTVIRYEKGSGKVNLGTVRHFAQFFGCDEGDLLLDPSARQALAMFRGAVKAAVELGLFAEPATARIVVRSAVEAWKQAGHPLIEGVMGGEDFFYPLLGIPRPETQEDDQSSVGVTRQISELAAAMDEKQARTVLRYSRILMGLEKPGAPAAEKIEPGKKRG